MKKSLLSLLILSTLALSGCNEKETDALNAQLNEKNQEISALKSEVAKLETALNSAKSQPQTFLPAIQTKTETLFEKNERVKRNDPEYLKELATQIPDKNSKEWEEASTRKLRYSLSTLTTKIDWLDKLLTDYVLKQYSDDQKTFTTKAQLIQYFNEMYAEDVKGQDEDSFLAGTEIIDTMSFVGQRENIATFTYYSYAYTGGAHGNYHTNYLNVDLNKKAFITLDDLVPKAKQRELRKALWESYQNEYRDENGKVMETFTNAEDFDISPNFYFGTDGVHFVYGTYEIGPFAEGEKELVLYWTQINPLLNPEFQRDSNTAFALE